MVNVGHIVAPREGNLLKRYIKYDVLSARMKQMA